MAEYYDETLNMALNRFTLPNKAAKRSIGKAV